MASRYEVHKDELKIKRNVGSDISELKTLYSQTPKFYSKMDFDEFLAWYASACERIGNFHRTRSASMPDDNGNAPYAKSGATIENPLSNITFSF